MLWIIGGFVAAIIVLIICGLVLSNVEDAMLEVMLAVLVLVCIISGFIEGLFGEPKEYTEPILKEEIELVSLNNTVSSEGGGNLFFVSVSASNIYTYRYQVKDKYNLGGKSYETDTLSTNVTEVESLECEKAVLKVYERKPIKKWWISFSIGCKPITEYVFYVPEGTIQKEVKLK